MEVKVTVETKERTIGGKVYQVTITRRKGLDTYIEDGKEFLADEAVFSDYGPRMGISRSYTLHKDEQPTEAEREAGRRRIQQVAAQAMIDQGIW